MREITLDSCLKDVKSVAIAGHVHPDGDCAGSCLAVYNYLRTYYPGIQADLFLEPISEKFLFLKNSDRIRSDAADVTDRTYDLFIALDCGDAGRLGDAEHLFRSAGHTFCADHHITNQHFADSNYVFPEASSTSELVFRLMDPEKITKEIAECLYLGIVHDTGVFQYSCTSEETMRIAGSLMARGIDYPRIVDETYYVKSFSQQQIWGKAMMESRLYLDGRCICSIVTKKDMEAFQAGPNELEGLVSELRSTDGVEVSILLYETENGYKISLRSARFVDVAAIASEFGGGGHARAAGASSPDRDPERILAGLLKRISMQLTEEPCTTES